MALESIDAKLAVLRGMFGDDASLRVFIQAPTIIMWNSAQLQRSFDYLAAIDGFDRSRLTKTPRLIMRGRDTILAPRHEFLQENDRLHVLKENQWIAVSNRDFVARFPGYKAWRAASRFGPLSLVRRTGSTALTSIDE